MLRKLDSSLIQRPPSVPSVPSVRHLTSTREGTSSWEERTLSKVLYESLNWKHLICQSGGSTLSELFWGTQYAHPWLSCVTILYPPQHKWRSCFRGH